MSGRPAGAPTAWRVAAASVAGTAHDAADTGCQDAHAVAVRGDGALVAAVADGAGSAPHSARGAAVAVAAAVGTLAGDGGEPSRTAGAGRSDIAGGDGNTGDGVVAAHGSGDQRDRDDQDADAAAVAAAVHAAAAAVGALAEADGRPVRELACTLSCAVVRPGGAVAAQVGDGLVVVRVDGALLALTAPERGDYANETVFLTSPGAVEAAAAAPVRVRGAVDGAALLTDGLLRLALRLADANPHPAFFGPLIDFAAAGPDPIDDALAAFLASPRVRDRTDDDVTLVVAARAASPPGP